MKVNAGRDQNSLLKSLFEALLLHGLSPYHTGAPKGLFQAPCKCSEEAAGIVVATTVSPVPSSQARKEEPSGSGFRMFVTGWTGCDGGTNEISVERLRALLL